MPPPFMSAPHARTRTLTHTYAHTHQAWQEAAEAVSGSAPDDADADKNE